jgi:hypothetical protein
MIPDQCRSTIKKYLGLQQFGLFESAKSTIGAGFGHLKNRDKINLIRNTCLEIESPCATPRGRGVSHSAYKLTGGLDIGLPDPVIFIKRGNSSGAKHI